MIRAYIVKSIVLEISCLEDYIESRSGPEDIDDYTNPDDLKRTLEDALRLINQDSTVREKEMNEEVKRLTEQVSILEYRLRHC